MTTLNILLQTTGGNGGALGSFIPLILIFLVMWLFMIRPQNKKQKEIEKARAAMKPGDKVISNGGIYGKIREVKDDSFIVEISENVRVRFEKSAIFAVPAPAPAKEKKDKSAPAKNEKEEK